VRVRVEPFFKGKRMPVMNNGMATYDAGSGEAINHVFTPGVAIFDAVMSYMSRFTRLWTLYESRVTRPRLSKH